MRRPPVPEIVSSVVVGASLVCVVGALLAIGWAVGSVVVSAIRGVF